MDYAKGFFEIQLRFAERVAALTGRTLAECIQSHTAFYACFGLGTKFDWKNPDWQHYVAGLESAADPLDWTYQTYRAIQQQIIPSPESFWGCFAWNLHFNDPTVIRLHFVNHDDSGYGPLSSARQSARIAELTAMFAVIQREAPQARLVRGESWLYNRREYCRLFPPEFGASAQPVEAAYQYRALWGQLVDSEGQVQAEVASAFLQKLSEQQDTRTLDQCFPGAILRTECALVAFYRFYGLTD